MSRKVMIEVDDNDIDDFIERGIVRAEVARNAKLMYESDDCVSRQAVNDLYDRYHPRLATHVYEFGEELKALPSVLPKRKQGKWITQYHVAHQKEYIYCSECREEFSYDGETGIEMSDYKYCPNCGAEMR